LMRRLMRSRGEEVITSQTHAGGRGWYCVTK
jgi:hypothetical protein